MTKYRIVKEYDVRDSSWWYKVQSRFLFIWFTEAYLLDLDRAMEKVNQLKKAEEHKSEVVYQDK